MLCSRAKYIRKVSESHYAMLKKETDECVDEFEEIHRLMMDKITNMDQKVAYVSHADNGKIVIEGDVRFTAPLQAQVNISITV